MSFPRRSTLRVPFVRSRFVTVTAVAALGGGLAAAPAISSAGSAVASAGSSVVKAPVFTLPLKTVGQVNLTQLAKSQRRTRVATVRQGGHISRSAAERTKLRVGGSAIAQH